MKNLYPIYFCLCLLLFASSSFRPTHFDKGTLVVQVTNLESSTGLVRLGIYRKSDRFLVERGFVGKSVPVVSGNNYARLEVPNLDFDTYALAVYHDLNGNFKLDVNRIGIPDEPYGFTSPIKSKWRRPTFEEMKFDFANNFQTIVIPVKRWSSY